MDLVCCRKIFDSLKLFRRHGHNLDDLTFIEFLQSHPLPVSEFNSIAVRRRVCRELPERDRLIFGDAMALLNAGGDSREAKLGSIRNADRALFGGH